MNNRKYYFESFTMIPLEKILINDEIERGSDGIVSRGEWESKKVAIKCYDISNIESKLFYENEKNIALRFAELPLHKNIIQFYGYAEDNLNRYLIMYLMHDNLENFLINLYDNEEAINFNLSLHLLLEIANGLNFLHQHEMIHGDLKPANVLLTTFNATFNAKLCDFANTMMLNAPAPGISRLGSPGYVAPELIKAYYEITDSDSSVEDKDSTECNEELPLSKKSDMYSFGFISYDVFYNEEQYPKTSSDNESSESESFDNESSFNKSPDGLMCPKDIFAEVLAGKRPEFPENSISSNIPNRFKAPVKHFIHSLWSQVPDSRLSVEDAIEQLQAFKNSY